MIQSTIARTLLRDTIKQKTELSLDCDNSVYLYI